MNEFIQNFQPTSDTIFRFLPEIVLAVFAMLTLALDVWLPKDRKKIGLAVASAGMLLAFAAQLIVPQMNMLLAAFFPICGFLAVHLASTVRERTEFQQPITNHLFLITTAAAMALMKTWDFISFFVLLETVTVSLYALVGSYRKSAYSLEAGVKYLIAGGVSGGLMLFGIVLLYGAVSLTGTAYGNPLDYSSVYEFFNENPDNILGLVGAGMVIAGIMFKLGVFPMQFWIPDVYQGAPAHVTFFLASLSKAVGFFLMAIMLSFPFLNAFPRLFPILLVLTLISIVYANITALGQQKVKRLLGLSGVSHAGYLMLGLLATIYLASTGNAERFQVFTILLLLYLFFYVTSLYPIFSVMARVPAQEEALQDFDDFRGLAKRSPVLAGALASGLGSLAGIPPTIGFITKLGILWIVFSAGLYVPATIMLACVVASVYYYFGWIRAAFSTDADDIARGNATGTLLLPSFFSRITLIFFTAFTVLGCLLYWAILNCIK